MASWYSEQLTNRNFLSPIGFLFLLDKAKKVSFLCQKAEIPELTLGTVDIPTAGLVRMPREGNVIYNVLSLDFIVDEDLRNYMELHNWMRALGTPQYYDERKDWKDKYAESPSEDVRFSDATLQVLNNNNNANFDVVFKDLFPIALSTLAFDVSRTDNEFMIATATFQYTLYKIRNVHSSTRR